MSSKRTVASIAEFCKAQISSLTATLVDFAVTALLFRFCGVYYVWSTFLGSVTGGVVNCVVNYKWTFNGNGQSKRRVAIRYCLVWGGSIVLNTWGTAIGARILSGKSDIELDSVLLSKVIVAVLVAVLWNFLMQKYFVYKKRK